MKKPPTPGIPNGWFAVAWSKDLTDGTVARARYFDQEMVVFRTREGKARVLDAFCPHLGAHLAEGGHVFGESVQCPFHGWRFDGETGRCIDIPYSKSGRIPQKAQVRAWDVSEANGLIYAWHHAEGKPPEWQVPVIPEMSHPDWAEPRTFELEVPVHLQEMAENNCDPVHFQYVHKMTGELVQDPATYTEGGRVMHVVSRSEYELPGGRTFPARLVRHAYDLGQVTVGLEGFPDAGLIMLACTSPIDRHHTHSRWSLTATKNLIDVAGEPWMRNMVEGVMCDLRIWENKIYRADPVLCEDDQHLADFRRWTEQFYSETEYESETPEEGQA